VLCVGAGCIGITHQDSQHTLVIVPVMRTVSYPRAQAVGQIAGALRERAEAPILDDLVFWLDVEVGP
jgi:hypothetical protein